MSYWLLKTEPDEFSIDDLQKCKKPEIWEGIRNYQARNIIRDQIKKGDTVLIYHSSCKNVGVAGVGEVVSDSYPCPFQFKKNHKYSDEKSSKDNPRWFVMDVAFKQKFDEVIQLKAIKAEKALAEMTLVKQGRLSVQPVKATEFKKILKMAEG